MEVIALARIVLCTTLPLLFPAMEMLRLLPLFDGIGF
jgi:hypothetical protein